MSLLLLIVDAVTCHTCKDSITGCRGGAACPLLVRCATNQAALVAGTLGVVAIASLIPSRYHAIFNRPVLDRLTHLSHASSLTSVFDPVGKTFTEIYTAVVNNSLGKVEACAALVTLLADTQLSDAMRSSISAALSAIAIIPGHTCSEAQRSVGAHLFVVAAALKYIHSKSQSVTATVADASVSTSAPSTRVIEIKLVPPATEVEFFEMLTLFIMFAHAVGLADVSISTAFITQIVFEKMRRRNYSWMMAYELFVVVISAFEYSDDPSASLANIVSDGGFDGHSEEAEAAGVSDYGAAFRKSRVAPRDNNPKIEGEPKEWNGKCTPSASKACISYNRDSKHPASSLTKNGTCKFKHVCFKWISGAGKDAICGGSHTFHKCDHPDACDAPATA